MPDKELLNAETLTTADLLKLPPTISVVTAGKAIGINRDTAYKLARSGTFPCKVIRPGTQYRVVTADLLRVLAINSDDENAAAAA